MFRNSFTLLLGAALVAGCARTVAVESGGEVAPEPVLIPARMLASGTDLRVRLVQRLSAKNSQVGDLFDANVTKDVTTPDGRLIVPAGAVVHGHITGLDPATQFDGRAVIRLNFDNISVDGHDHPFSAVITDVHPELSELGSNQTAHSAVIGAAAGAVLGAILGGAELDKILAGSVLGAAAGTVVSMGKGDLEGALPAGTVMTIRATEDVMLRREPPRGLGRTSAYRTP